MSRQVGSHGPVSKEQVEAVRQELEAMINLNPALKLPVRYRMPAFFEGRLEEERENVFVTWRHRSFS